jgi:two-component system sensor histidine kinase PilS (NtrC family)
MAEDSVTHSWLNPGAADAVAGNFDSLHEMSRQWQGFMTARLLLGFVLVTLQTALYAAGTLHSQAQIAISTAYLVGTLASKLFIQPRPLGQSFNRIWGALVGIDLLTFSALQMLQSGPANIGTINYTPLFALPVLVASVLGSMRLALGTAAGITMLMLGVSTWSYLQSATDSAPYFVQPALSGVGYFAIAWLSNQLASRLTTEGQRARQSQLAASIQRQVNELVIESLPDGVLIVDERGWVHAANPAARQLLGSEQALHAAVFDLKEERGWLPLVNLNRLTVGTGESHEEDITIRHGQHGPRRVHARTRLAAPQGATGESLCVLFLQDQRELEARMRTEKLAGMGRLSTAVAHEIRNPLSAITQANALLDEDLSDPKLKRLTAMVSQNAKRLEKIVNDILNVSRVQPYDPAYLIPVLPLDTTIHRICADWASQTGAQGRLTVHTCDPTMGVHFDSEHLRRVLVNLLDNAHRHTQPMTDAIQVLASVNDRQHATISIWSDAPPMDQSVERHLFEPFFSSDSRSSGLGLFICRELCERHDASLIYQRNVRTARGQATDGNEFVVTVRRSHASDNLHTAETSITPWQHPLY